MALFNTTPPLLLVGLGNPGREYTHTRHNIGFMLLEAVQQKYGLGTWQKKFNGLVSSGSVAGQKVVLLQPQTFMNVSGQAVLPAVTFYKIKPAGVLVVHDDIDLPFGTLRQKKGGGDAGHNGLKSITQALGSEYHRLRLGVGRPQAANEKAAVPDVADYVLQAFSAEEQPKVTKWLTNLAEELPGRLAGLV